jgi:hypothetical protein
VIVVALIAAIILLAGCGGPDKGEIVEKMIEPEKTWTSFQTVGGGCSPSGVCTPGTQIPVTHVDDEDPKFLLRDCASADGGECDEGWKTVSHETFAAHEVGDYYEEE